MSLNATGKTHKHSAEDDRLEKPPIPASAANIESAEEGEGLASLP